MENRVASLSSGISNYNAQLVNSAQAGDGVLSLIAAQSQYLQMSSITTGLNGLTFSVWFKSSSATYTSFPRIFDFSNGAASDNIYAAFDSTNNNLVVNVFVGAIQGPLLRVAGNANNNVWHHLVWTLVQANGVYGGLNTVYFDGVVLNQVPGIYPNSLQRNLNYLGKSPFSVDSPFNGQITNFRFYDRVLSVAEVANLYDKRK
jgi:hypothetical protein